MIGRLATAALILCLFAAVVSTCAQCAVAVGEHGADACAFVAWTFAERGAWWVFILAAALLGNLEPKDESCPRR